MPYATVIDLEAEWFALDLTTDDVPALRKADGGPFDEVAARPRQLSQAPHQLFLAHGPTTHLPGAKGTRRVQHEVVALIFWPNPGAAQRSHEDQLALDAATERVVARIRGPLGQQGRTHGDRWWRVADPRVEPPSPVTLLTFRDIVGAVGAGFEVLIRYNVQEWVDA